MEGSSHLSDEEIDEYDSLCIKPNGTIITDDSDSFAEYTEEDWWVTRMLWNFFDGNQIGGRRIEDLISIY